MEKIELWSDGYEKIDFFCKWTWIFTINFHLKQLHGMNQFIIIVMVCYSKVCYGKVCYGKVCYGKVWYGKVWYVMLLLN